MSVSASSRSLQHYLNRLTNLNNRNSAIFLGKISQKYIDLGSLITKSPKGLQEGIYHLWDNNKSLDLVRFNESQNHFEQSIGNRIQKIKGLADLIYEESGSWNLNLGFPMVRGILAKDGGKLAVHAPLMLKPVTLEKVGLTWQLVARADEPATINKSLILALANYKNVDVPTDLLDLTTDDLGSETSNPLTDLHNAVKEVHEISEFLGLLNSELKPYDEFNKVDFLAAFELESFQYTGEAVVGLFQQVDQYLMNDYKLLIDGGIKTVSEIFEGLKPIKKEDEIDSNGGIVQGNTIIKEQDKVIPLAVDSSQEQVIERVKNGESLVVQGPPGTGKSQLIANLASDYLARGKKVLVVCQKKAALEVVKARLETLNIGEYLGLIEDFTEDRPALYAQLNKNVEALAQVFMGTVGADTVEADFAQASTDLEQSLFHFQGYKQALFQSNESGIAVKDLYLGVQNKPAMFNANAIYKEWSWPVFQREWSNLQLYFTNQQTIPSNSFWYNRNNLSGYAKQSFTNELESNLPVLLQWLPALGTKLFADAAKFEEQQILITDCKNADMSILQALWQQSKSQEALLAWLDQVNLSFKDKIYNELNTSGIADLQGAINYIEATNASFHLQMDRLFKPEFEEALICLEGAKESVVTLPIAMNTLQARYKYQDLLNAAPVPIESKWKDGTIDRNWLLNFTKHIKYQIELINQLESNEFILKFKDVIEPNKLASFLSEVSKTATAVNGFYQKVKTFISEKQFELMVEGKFILPQIVQEWQQYSIAIQGADQLYAGSNESTKELIKLVGDSYFKLSIPQIQQELWQSIATLWIEYLEHQYPVLNLPASPTLNAMEQQLQTKITDKQDLSAKLLHLRLKAYAANAWNGLTDNPKKKHFATRLVLKRRVWPVRKMFENFREEMTALIPCWLMTPDMVSAIMPLERAMFDLVIFDEASQCFSERGLPAIYRAKQLVIAGDDKQLQPFDLGRIRFVSDTEEEEDTDEVVALEARSLLELSRQFLSGDMLRTHYRSRSLDLISFSNVQFYEGKLQTIPHFHTIQEQVRGVQWIKVPGVLKDSTNHIEAEKAIQVVLDLVRAGETSLGIVSFNAAQQELITDLLRLRSQQEQITLPKGLFVKNIENVQGDERDIIVLSITYAKDDKGVFRRHFGDLSLAGGENKLNVAVTRARKQIYVISSISGGDINSESLANQGPKLLEAYLRYAEQVSVGSFEEAAVKGNPQISAYKLSDKMAGKKESLRKNLSFADLVEYQGTIPASLILTDDDLYFQRSSKETHGYLPLILNQKGWQYRYYYSRGWHEGS